MNAQRQQDVCIRLGPGRRLQCALREGRRPARSPWSPGPGWGVGGRGGGWGGGAGGRRRGLASREGPRGGSQLRSCGDSARHSGTGGAESSSFTQGRRPAAFPAPPLGRLVGTCSSKLRFG